MLKLKKLHFQKWKSIYRQIMDVADQNEIELRRAIRYSLKLMK